MAKIVLIAGFKHETNTFSTLPTDLAAYRTRALYRGVEIPQAYGGTRTEIAAFVEACARHGWRPLYATVAEATPSGKVTREAYEAIAGEIVGAVDAYGPVDGVLLQLHGAMVAEHTDDGEGTLLERLRARVGRGPPVAATLDLHANVTDRMARLADILVSYRTYPHVDMYEVGAEAADLLARAMAGRIRPRVVVARGPLLDGADHGRTTEPGPMSEVLASAARLGREPGVLSISVNAGFPWADMAEAGPSAVVVGDGDSPRYGEIAQALIGEIWDTRHRTTLETVPLDGAVAAVRARGAADRPLVLADFADNPGGGGYGDSTGLLAALLKAGVEDAAFATIYDPEAAAACHEAGEGATVTLRLGGKVDPRLGAPVAVTGTVARLTDGRLVLDGPMAKGVRIDMGPSARLSAAGLDVVIASGRYQVYDQQFFKHLGIEPAQKAVLALKSAHHFRAAFGPIAGRIVVVDAGGGLTSRNFKALPYRKVRRPVFPLDLD